MKNLFLIFFTVLMALTATAQEKFAYRWVYTIDSGTRKYVPTSLRLFDHAYAHNMKFLFSCMNKLANQNYGTLLAFDRCKKQVSDESGQWIINSHSFENDFKDSGYGLELKIRIVNRPDGFSKMIGCLAGRSKYKNPVEYPAILTECRAEISEGKTDLELKMMTHWPLDLSSQSTVRRSIKVSNETLDIYGYLTCLKYHGRKNLLTVSSEDEVFKYCFQELEKSVNSKDKSALHIGFDFPYNNLNYSRRMNYAIDHLKQLQNYYSPLALAQMVERNSRLYNNGQLAIEALKNLQQQKGD